MTVPAAPLSYVYVAGPYTGGDPVLNVRVAIETGQQIADAGFIPFVPHLFHFWHHQIPGGYEQWMKFDLAWLEKCDALVRLPGESPGADREVIRARELGIPVYNGIEAFLPHGTVRGEATIPHPDSVPVEGPHGTVRSAGHSLAEAAWKEAKAAHGHLWSQGFCTECSVPRAEAETGEQCPDRLPWDEQASQEIKGAQTALQAVRDLIAGQYEGDVDDESVPYSDVLQMVAELVEERNEEDEPEWLRCPEHPLPEPVNRDDKLEVRFRGTTSVASWRNDAEVWHSPAHLAAWPAGFKQNTLAWRWKVTEPAKKAYDNWMNERNDKMDKCAVCGGARQHHGGLGGCCEKFRTVEAVLTDMLRDYDHLLDVLGRHEYATDAPSKTVATIIEELQNAETQLQESRERGSNLAKKVREALGNPASLGVPGVEYLWDRVRHVVEERDSLKEATDPEYTQAIVTARGLLLETAHRVLDDRTETAREENGLPLALAERITRTLDEREERAAAWIDDNSEVPREERLAHIPLLKVLSEFNILAMGEAVLHPLRKRLTSHRDANAALDKIKPWIHDPMDEHHSLSERIETIGKMLHEAHTRCMQQDQQGG